MGHDTLACSQCREIRRRYERHESYPVRLQNKGLNPLMIRVEDAGYDIAEGVRRKKYTLIDKIPLRDWTVAQVIKVHSTALQPVSIWGVTPRSDRWHADNIFKP